MLRARGYWELVEKVGDGDVATLRPPHGLPKLPVLPHPVAVAPDVDDVAMAQQPAERTLQPTEQRFMVYQAKNRNQSRRE